MSYRSLWAIGLAGSVLLGMTACRNSQVGDSVQRSFAADPRLESNPGLLTQAPGRGAALPADFPPEIPLYPQAVLQAVVPEPTTNSPDQPNTTSPTTTQWNSPDPRDRIQRFYQQELAARGWEILSRPNDNAAGPFVAQREGIQISVAIADSPPQANPPGAASGSQFSIQYGPIPTADNPATDNPATPSSSPEVSAESSFRAGAALSPDRVVIASSPVTDVASEPLSPQTFTDLNQIPPTLQSAVTDLAALGVLQVRSTDKPKTATGQQFEPNRITTRREYARWLVLANNRLYSDRPAQQIRLGTSNETPVFQDVPATDPDFPYIQGLADAGILPSALSGDAVGVRFRPDAPLTRETLLLWKAPLDSRQALPNATLEAIKQTWGFQDASRIDPKVWQAVLADYQTGDLSNIRRVWGYTTLLQPKKGVSRAEAAATVWYFGGPSDGISAQEILRSNPQAAP